MSRSSNYKNYSNRSSYSSSQLPLQYDNLNKNKNIIPLSISNNTPGFLQTMKDGVALGIGSSIGQLITSSVLGNPKVNVERSSFEHTYINDNIKINPCINTSQNCSEILLEYEKCKGDYNCNFDKLDKLKNDYEKCQNNIKN